MSKPQPPSPEPHVSEHSDERQSVETDTVNPTWLAAAAFLTAFDQPAAAAGNVSEDVWSPTGRHTAGERPGAEPSGIGAATGPASWAAGALQSSAAWADGAWADPGGAAAWRLPGVDPALPADDLVYEFAPDFAPGFAYDFAYDFAPVSQSAVWSDGALPAAFAGHGVGQFHPAPGPDLIFLDTLSYARPTKAEKGGGNGGGKGKKGGGSDGSSDGSEGSEPGSLSEYLSGDPDGYNILIDFEGAWTSALQDAFTDAADLVSDLIVGDLADVFFRGKIIDDLNITAELVEIDGVNGVLGQAGPTAIRTADYLPAVGVMEFDSADADAFLALDLWDEIVLHEMLHTVGFGSVWDYLGLVADAGTSDPIFTGDQATLAYRSLFDDADAAGVPLEQDGGAGTVESHWDEDVFGSELMTGYLDATGNYLSDVTVASLADLGYETAALAAVA